MECPEGIREISDVLEQDVVAKYPLDVLFLAAGNPFSRIPELYLVLGLEKFREVLRIFNGSNFSMPTEREFLTKLRDFEIFKALELQDDSIVEALADKYSLSVSEVRAICSRVRTKLRKAFLLDIVSNRLKYRKTRELNYEFTVKSE